MVDHRFAQLCALLLIYFVVSHYHQPLIRSDDTVLLLLQKAGHSSIVCNSVFIMNKLGVLKFHSAFHQVVEKAKQRERKREREQEKANVSKGLKEFVKAKPSLHWLVKLSSQRLALVNSIYKSLRLMRTVICLYYLSLRMYIYNFNLSTAFLFKLNFNNLFNLFVSIWHKPKHVGASKSEEDEEERHCLTLAT